MQDEPTANDPKHLWQNQPAEPSTMTLKLIRSKARDLRAKTRRELMGNLAVGLFAIILSATGLSRGLGGEWIHTLFVAAIVWAIAGQYFLHRGMWSPALDADAALTTGLDFCRREIERRLRLFHRVLLWAGGPLLLAIGAFLAPLIRHSMKQEGGVTMKMAPFFTLLGLWFIGLLYTRMQGRRELRREMDELNELH